MSLRELLAAIRRGESINLSQLDKTTVEAILRDAQTAFRAGYDIEAKQVREGQNRELVQAVGRIVKAAKEYLAQAPAAPPAAPAPAEGETFDLDAVAALLGPETPAAPPAPAATGGDPAAPPAPPGPPPAPAEPPDPEALARAAASVDLGALNPAGGSGQQPHGTAPQPKGLVAAAGPDSFYDPARETEMPLERLHEIVSKRAEAIMHNVTTIGGTVARIASTNLPMQSPERLNENNTAGQNTAQLRKLLDQTPKGPDGVAKVAAGGFLGPIDFSREIPWFVQAGRPVKDSLRVVPAQRGRIKLNRAMKLYEVEPATPAAATYPGIGVWDEAADAAATLDDPDTWKVCEEMDAAFPLEVQIDTYALTRCFIHSHMQAMSSPELLAALLQRQRTRFDRMAEARLLQKLFDTAAAAGTHYTYAPPYGQATDLFFGLWESLQADGWINRWDMAGATVYYPKNFLRYLLAADHNSGFGDRSLRTNDIKSIMNDMGFSGSVEFMDDRAGATAWTFTRPANNGAIADQHNTVFPMIVLFPEDWVMLDAGVIDFGVDRDLMSRINKVKTQWESFEGVGNIGNRPILWVDVTLCANGSRAALVTPYSCA